MARAAGDGRPGRGPDDGGTTGTTGPRVLATRLRPGLAGVWDAVVGPGAKAAENVGTVVAALGGAAGAFLDASSRAGYPPWLSVVAAALAFDVVAGVWVLATPAGRRWYGHLAGRWQVAFTAAHVHPFIVAWLFPGAPWVWAAWLYCTILVVSAVAWRSPPALRPPLTLVACVPIVTGAAVLGPAAPVWFAPTLALKLLASRSLSPHRRPARP